MTQQRDDTIRSAEHAVEDAANRTGRFLARLIARTREEAEDIWAEAQAMSRSRR